MSNIRIFTGHFGSGKTEIAINTALDLKSKGKKVTIVDIDIVNPYFCVRDLKSSLEEKGIKVVSSNPEYVNAELMVVPSEVMTVFNDDKDHEVIIDVGGDDQGAIALGQYNRYFRQYGYQMYFVINNNRPLTKESEDTEKFIRDIEMASRLKVTGLIANTNLSYETEINHVLEGHEKTMELSKKLNISYKYLTCRKDLVEEIKNKVDVEVYGLDIFMKPPWR
ncbi:ATP-binding protein [Haloimpatiens massiliensis]|uniref:ATP-binding protein n=1 Tax=Haloimpatiens massiliensis TaxID=1658110 RepID=UPI000C856C27|nr:ATP-binding protein [Haloimpatiens massiliensis]